MPGQKLRDAADAGERKQPAADEAVSDALNFFANGACTLRYVIFYNEATGNHSAVPATLEIEAIYSIP
jgi:hypothetical protein